MGEPIVFTIRLTANDWDPSLRAWFLPALDIPGAFIKEAFEQGQPIATNLFEIDKGPARLSWKGPGQQPTQMTLVVGLREELSPTSAEQFWKRLAIVIPIITALIGAGATWLSKPGAEHTLRLSVEPADAEARIMIDNQEFKPPVDYKFASQVSATIDINKALQLAKAQSGVQRSCTGEVSNLNTAIKDLNDLNSAINGNICSGGSSGVPSPVRGGLSQKATAIADKLRDISSNLSK